MPTLKTYQSDANIQRVQQPDMGLPFRQAGEVALDIAQGQMQVETAQKMFDNHIEEIRLKNQVDTATIGYKSELMQLEDEFDPSTMSPVDHRAAVEELRTKYSDAIQNPYGQQAFHDETEIHTQKSSIMANFEYNKYNIEQSKNIAYLKMKDGLSLPVSQREEYFNSITSGMVNDRLITQVDADTLKANFVQDSILADAGKSLESAMSVYNTLKDPNQTTYKIDPDKINTVLGGVHATVERLTLDSEKMKLSYVDQYVQLTDKIIGSDAPFEEKSRQIFNEGKLRGMSDTQIDAASARLNLNMQGVQPSTSQDVYSEYKIELENLKGYAKDGEISDFDSAMEFMQRAAVLRERLDADAANGTLGYNDAVKLNTEYGTALKDAESLALGQIKDEDDTPFTFMPDQSFSYSEANDFFTEKIANPQVKSEAFNSYVRIVERMEETGKYPSFVKKGGDKWQKRRDVANHIKAQVDGNAPIRAKKILEDAITQRPIQNRIGALTAESESNNKGSMAIGYDEKGGTSYGTYQISSAQGTMGEFIDFLKTDNPKAYNVLSAAGNPNTGSKNGKFVDAWKKIAGDITLQNSEYKFIKKNHYDKALEKIKPEIAQIVKATPQLKEALFSTAVQHGSSENGAPDIFNKVYRDGMSPKDILRAVYEERYRRNPSDQKRYAKESKKLKASMAG